MAHGYNNRQSKQLCDSPPLPQILINSWWRQVNRPFALWRGYFGLIGSKSGFIFRTSCRQQKERLVFSSRSCNSSLPPPVSLRGRFASGADQEAEAASGLTGGDEKGLCPGRRNVNSGPFVRKSERRRADALHTAAQGIRL